MSGMPASVLEWLDPFDGRCCSLPGALAPAGRRFWLRKWVVDVPGDMPRRYCLFECRACGRPWMQPISRGEDGTPVYEGRLCSPARADGSWRPCLVPCGADEFWGGRES